MHDLTALTVPDETRSGPGRDDPTFVTHSKVGQVPLHWLPTLMGLCYSPSPKWAKISMILQ
jgi:hypothetical protein